MSSKHLTFIIVCVVVVLLFGARVRARQTSQPPSPNVPLTYSAKVPYIVGIQIIPDAPLPTTMW